MKSFITCLPAVFVLAGCVAVPYYGEPAPAGYYYGAPAPSVSFSYSYRDGGYYHHRHW